MSVEFYDNLKPSPVDGLPDLVEVERIYCFDWDRFGEPEWQELLRIYWTLPGVIGGLDLNIPCWFGENEEIPPFLWASVDLPGLQVYGILTNVDWSDWDKQFRSASSGLPMRAL